MTIAEREAQIIQIQTNSRYPEVNQALEEALRQEAQATIEAALTEAQHQRCVTHQVTDMVRHLNYEH